jgi:hypothetical protein
MALMLVISGICGVFAGLVGYSFRVIRDAEDILQDYDVHPSEKLSTEG